jgi:hypothetical protein
MSLESAQSFLENLFSSTPKFYITYYTRKRVNLTDPLVTLPARLVETAEVVYWFELYASEPKILKNQAESFTDWLGQAWKRHIKI